MRGDSESLIKLIETDVKTNIDQAWATANTRELQVAVLLVRAFADVMRENTIRLADALSGPEPRISRK